MPREECKKFIGGVSLKELMKSKSFKDLSRLILRPLLSRCVDQSSWVRKKCRPVWVTHVGKENAQIRLHFILEQSL